MLPLLRSRELWLLRCLLTLSLPVPGRRLRRPLELRLGRWVPPLLVI